MKSTINTRITALLSGFVMVLSLLSSCKKDFGDINKPWDNKIYAASIPALFTQIESQMGDQSKALYSGFIYDATQLAVTYQGGGRPIQNLAGDSWYNLYGIMGNYNKAMDLIEADTAAAKMVNIKAALKTIVSLRALQVTTLYGDAPYSAGGKAYKGIEYYRPAYDKQADIFKGALSELKWAVDNFSTDAGQRSLSPADVLLKGNIALWKKFANSVRLRYAIILRNKDAAAADAIIADALTKPLLDDAENIIYGKPVVDISTNRRGSFVQGQNYYIRMGSTLWSAMSRNNADDGSGIYDLRTKIFFVPNSDGKWVAYPQVPTNDTKPETIATVLGGDPYEAMPQTKAYYYSAFNYYYLEDPDNPDLIFTGWEVNFLKAEVYNRGLGGVAANPAMAKQFYEKGITASVKYWYKFANGSQIWTINRPPAEPLPADLTNMLSEPSVAYSATPATALLQIYKQAWIGFLHMPFDAWVLQRRTGYATPYVAPSQTNPGYNLNRLPYPSMEASSNFDNWKIATGGTDDRSVKLWFMP